MGDVSPARVLVVEDNDASARDYARYLGEAGHKVEHAAARQEALERARAFKPDVVLLDLQIPSAPGRADEDVAHGLATLDALLADDPFRPIVVITAHSRDREVMRQVLQRTRGGQFVFKDAEELDRELQEAVAIALASPAYRMSRAVHTFRSMLEKDLKEDDYRQFLHKHWQVFLGPEYADCESPYEISRGAKVDLLAIRHDRFPDLWELKLPRDPLFQEYGQWKHHSIECARAMGQLLEYCDAAAKEPRWGRNYDARRGLAIEMHRPRGFVVIGRYRDDDDRERLRLENSVLAGLAILTYDDLIERAEQLLHFLQSYRNGTDLVPDR